MRLETYSIKMPKSAKNKNVRDEVLRVFFKKIRRNNANWFWKSKTGRYKLPNK